MNSEMYDKFIASFLGWYQNSFSQPDVVNHIKLVELVKQAEGIHTKRVMEREAELLIKGQNIQKNTLKKLKKHIDNLKNQGKIKGRLVKYTKKHSRK